MIAEETAKTATALGLRLAFTPVRSPQSNGISEAFVKTLKRDYARNVILTDAKTIPGLLAVICEGAALMEAAKIGAVTLQIVRDWMVKFTPTAPTA